MENHEQQYVFVCESEKQVNWVLLVVIVVSLRFPYTSRLYTLHTRIALGAEMEPYY